MGDPVCWLDRICAACGRFLERADVEAARCPRCGADLPQDEEQRPGGPAAGR